MYISRLLQKSAWDKRQIQYAQGGGLPQPQEGPRCRKMPCPCILPIRRIFPTAGIVSELWEGSSHWRMLTTLWTCLGHKWQVHRERSRGHSEVPNPQWNVSSCGKCPPPMHGLVSGLSKDRRLMPGAGSRLGQGSAPSMGLGHPTGAWQLASGVFLPGLSFPPSPLEGERDSRRLWNCRCLQHSREVYNCSGEYRKGERFQVGRRKPFCRRRVLFCKKTPNPLMTILSLFVQGKRLFSCHKYNSWFESLCFLSILFFVLTVFDLFHIYIEEGHEV